MRKYPKIFKSLSFPNTCLPARQALVPTLVSLGRNPDRIVGIGNPAKARPPTTTNGSPRYEGDKNLPAGRQAFGGDNFGVSSNKKSLTSFQWQVLGVAAMIPYAETRSYQWIAKKIGRPKAARAVGQALRINPFAPVIPCHRVIRTDGSLGGYQGKSGLAKKEFLLKIEKETAGHLR